MCSGELVGDAGSAVAAYYDAAADIAGGEGSLLHGNIVCMGVEPQGVNFAKAILGART